MCIRDSADHEVPDYVLRDQERPLQVNDRVGRGIEVDDVIRGLAVPVDLVRQAPTAPRGCLDDLAAGAGNLPADLLQERLDAVIRRIRPDLSLIHISEPTRLLSIS